MFSPLLLPSLYVLIHPTTSRTHTALPLFIPDSICPLLPSAASLLPSSSVHSPQKAEPAFSVSLPVSHSPSPYRRSSPRSCFCQPRTHLPPSISPSLSLSFLLLSNHSPHRRYRRSLPHCSRCPRTTHWQRNSPRYHRCSPALPSPPPWPASLFSSVAPGQQPS